MLNSEQILKNVRVFLPKDTKLAITCANIIKVFAEFQKISKTEQGDRFENDPNWFPLLAKEDQVEVGQRIFLHAMNETKNTEGEKLWFAQIFLRKPICQQEMKHVEIEKLAYEMACVLRGWQIEKCDQLIQFLGRLKEGTQLPEKDRDGLLTWLKTKKRKQNSFTLFKEILVSPCCFSQCSIESALDKLNRLSLAENPVKLLKKHWGSYWGAIWESNDTLIQLPKSFHTDIFPEFRAKQDDTSQTLKRVSASMYELATALVTELKRLKDKLDENKSFYFSKMSLHNEKQKKAAQEQKEKAHELGVARIKKAQSHTNVITSPANSLYPYLYEVETVNEEDKKRQVPTVEDLIQVIYLGLDPNGACHWKYNFPIDPLTNQLAYYFMPGQFMPKSQEEKPLLSQEPLNKDSRTKAWIYACTEYQINVVPALAYLFSNPDRPLALTNTPEADVTVKNALSIQAILKNPNKKLSLAHSKALSGVTPDTLKETEAAIQQLQDYYILALVRVKPEYLTILPFMKQVECLVKNLFKFGKEIGGERLESVRIYIGDFCTILSEESIETINKGLDNFKKTYNTRFAIAQIAHRAHKSSLYTLMEKVMRGPIVAIEEQMGGTGVFSARQLLGEIEQGENVHALGKGAQAKIEEAQEKTEKERKEKEAAQAREKEAQARATEAQKKAEKEQKEKEEAQAEIERLKALLAERKEQTPPQPSLARSPATLFSASNAPFNSSTATTKNPVLKPSITMLPKLPQPSANRPF